MRLIGWVALVAFAAGILPTAQDGCGNFGGWCANVENSGTSVEVGGETTDPGDGGDGVSNPDAGADTGADEPPAAAPRTPLCTGSLDCVASYSVETLPEVTASDLARFTPTHPQLTSEPDGVAIVGMPANLVAAADTQVIAGRLFEYDVTVRFTPAGYRFDHGDGTVSTSDTGGRSWASLGQAQFTPTSTSHVYVVRGRYTVAATVLFRAEVDFGGGRWRPVTGFVESTGPGQQIRVVEAHTALVQHTCLERPDAAGC